MAHSAEVEMTLFVNDFATIVPVWAVLEDDVTLYGPPPFGGGEYRCIFCIKIDGVISSEDDVLVHFGAGDRARVVVNYGPVTVEAGVEI